MLNIKLWRYEDLTEVQREDMPDNGSGKEYAGYLMVSEGVRLIALESDAMEPEDCSFSRDLKWIPALLKKVYEKGIEDGKDLIKSNS